MTLIRQYRVWLTELKRYILSHVSAIPSVLQSMAIYRNFCLPGRHRGATIYQNSCLPRRHRGATIYQIFCLPRRHRGATIYLNSCLPKRHNSSEFLSPEAPQGSHNLSEFLSPKVPQGSYNIYSMINSMPSLNLSLLNLDWGVTDFPWQLLANFHVALWDRVSFCVAEELHFPKASSPLSASCLPAIFHAAFPDKLLSFR